MLANISSCWTRVVLQYICLQV